MGLTKGINPLTKDRETTAMIESPQIIQTSTLHAAIIPVTVPRAQIGEAMMPGLTEIMAAVKAQGIGPAGVWFTHHLRIEPEIFDFEICVPVTAAVKPVGRVIPGVWPGMKVIRTVYHGPYEGMGDAWGEFEEWIETQGLKAPGTSGSGISSVPKSGRMGACIARS